MPMPSARNTAITRRVLDGASCVQVAQDYGLTPVRVHQIVHQTLRQMLKFSACSPDEQLALLNVGLTTWRRLHAWRPLPLGEKEGV